MREETQINAISASQKPADELYDVIIVGAGPAGMSAALCAKRAKMTVLLLDSALPGGEASTAYHVDNYIGFPDGIMGVDLAQKMEDHIRAHDVEFVCDEVDDILSVSSKEKHVHTELGSIYRSRSVILAVGLEPKPLGSDFEKRFMGRGVSYYAQGDGESYKGKVVAVIGGGNCACYAADYLSRYAEQLYLIHRSNDLKAVKSLKETVLNNPRIQTIWDSEVVDAFGVDRVEKIKLKNQVTGQHTWLDAKCIFVYAGRIPPKAILAMDLETDAEGFLLTDESMRTNIPGIYAAGDSRSKEIRQIATAVSDGMIAAITAGRDLG